MKICIITCQNAVNHGARLQCYALVHWLQKQGHSVEVIDYRPTYSLDQKLFYWPGLSLKSWIKLPLYYPVRKRNIERRKVFDVFSKKYLPLTSRIYYTIEDLRKNPPMADLYIAGSDQIWNTTLANGTDPAYYLDFGSDNVLRESFAASFATESLKSGSDVFVREQLKKFDKITVREQSALKILEYLGFEGSQQEDPVFLLSTSEWDEVSDGTGVGERYVLVYDFYLGNDIHTAAQKIAKEKGLKIYNISHSPLSYADKNFIYSGPETFVSLIRNASYLISNSFHGTAFAMIFDVPFKVLDRPDGLNVRMHDLLERHGYKLSEYLLV
jgi:hypothetical protein